MPYMYRETVFLKDPNLFDIRYTGNVDIAMQEPSDLIQPEMQDADKESDDKKWWLWGGGERGTLWAEPNFIDMLKQRIMLSNFLLSENKQNTSHILYV